jgi:hypothetical protein
MEALVWPFVGLLVFASWLVLVNFRSGERGSRERRSKMLERRAWERRLNQEFWARAAGETARLRAESARLKRPFAEPEITSGEIDFGEGAEEEPRRRAAGAG